MPKQKRSPDWNLWSKLKPEVRQMRKEPTEAEMLLWEKLRDRQLNGHKFRRQCAIDRFIVDFYCPAKSLVIEADGPIHIKQAEEDQERDQILSRLGLRVIRFQNEQILLDMNQVLADIQKAIDETPVRTKLRPIVKNAPSPVSPARRNWRRGWGMRSLN